MVIRNTLSLFNGISIGRASLEDLGLEIQGNHYISEIDKYACAISKFQYPDEVQLGDLTRWRDWDIDWASIDLLFAGFSCQSWSMAGKQQGDKDARGALMWIMLDIRDHILELNPNMKFLFENVKMKKSFQEYVNKAIGYEPILINSALVSAQNRNRLYWTNIEGIVQPEDRGILLKDTLEENVEERYFLSDKLIRGLKEGSPAFKGRFNPHTVETKKSYCLTARYYKMGRTDPYLATGAAQRGRYNTEGKVVQQIELNNKSKSNSLTTVQKDSLLYLNQKELDRAKKNYSDKVYPSGNRMSNMKFPDGCDRKDKTVCTTQLKGSREFHHIEDNFNIRRFTPIECERLQTYSDNYTAKGVFTNKKGEEVIKDISNTQRYKVCGNGWNKETIKHILSYLK